MGPTNFGRPKTCADTLGRQNVASTGAAEQATPGRLQAAPASPHAPAALRRERSGVPAALAASRASPFTLPSPVASAAGTVEGWRAVRRSAGQSDGCGLG